MNSIRAFAPASIGNVAAGFDVLGAALAPLDGGPIFGDRVEITEAEGFSFAVEGPFAHRLPADPESNLVLRALRRFQAALEGAEEAFRDVRVTLHKGLPVNSGLGSSAASGVAALAAFNAWCGEPLSALELLPLSGEVEATVSGSVHLDNSAPSLLGGLRLVAPGGKVRSLPWPEDLLFVIAMPELELPTAQARAALPAALPIPDAVAYAQNLAAFVHALHASDRALLRACLRDVLAEPHRAPLVKGFRPAQQAALEAGALGCSLSGSGPATFAVADAAHAEAVATALVEGFKGAGVACAARLCGLDPLGARVLP